MSPFTAFRRSTSPIPGRKQQTSSSSHSAVELFVTRAKALDTGFSPQPEDLTSIAEICRHLDGIPLAIEFAAARAAFVGTEQVAAGLRDRFALLSSGRRTTIPRHRTLRAALDWSYELLSAEEQRLLRHLAVFPAGFTFEAAAGRGWYWPSRPVDRRGIVQPGVQVALRTRQFDRSNAMASAGDDTRLCAGETRREWRVSGRRAAVTPSISGISSLQWLPDSKAWLSHDDVARCSRELDNVRAALDWAFSPDGDAEIGAKLTAAFAPIWQTLSLVGECRDRIERMSAALAAEHRPEPAARVAHVDRLLRVARDDIGADRAHSRCRQEGDGPHCGRRMTWTCRQACSTCNGQSSSCLAPTAPR